MRPSSAEEILRIDRIRCDGSGLCAELLPELIQRDEWGYPILVPEPIPEGLRRQARDAIRLCPRLALRSFHA